MEYKMIKPREIRWAGPVEVTREKCMVGKSERKKKLGRLRRRR
jgi:hypothetical protein